MSEIKFTELNLIPEMQRAIDELGFENPTDIQAEAIPKIREGRDIIGKSQTGTGKTLAFDMAQLNGNTVYFRTGSGDGTTSCIAIVPALDIAVTLNANGNADLMALANVLLDILQ